MFAKKTTEHNPLADQVALTADHAIRTTQQVANDTLNGLSDSVANANQAAAPLLNRATEQAAVLAQRSIDAVRDTSRQLRDKALLATDTTAGYIKNDPIKAVLIAAATGAALMALVTLISRSRDRA